MTMNWRERYRPTSLDDMVGCERFKADAQGWEQVPPCMVFSGPPGTGKTTAAYALARTMLGDLFDPINFYATNASDDRGIDFIRSLKEIARQGGIGTPRKYILLDEADSFTSQAQKALRQIMEESHATAVFILTVNDVGPMHQAIKDRCVSYTFQPHTDEDAEKLYLQIHEKEGLPDNWVEHYRSLNRLCAGSLRRGIDMLEATHKSDDALAKALKGISHGLSDAALLVCSGKHSELAGRLRLEIEKGMTRFSMLNGLLPRVRDIYEDASDYYTFVSTWGDFMDKVATWPADDATFVDYFIAKLIERSEKNE